MTKILSITTIFFTLFSLSARAQSPRASGLKGVSNPWEIGFHISPILSDLLLVNKADDSSLRTVIELRNETEAAKLSLSAGVSLGYRLNKNYGLETGLQYSNLGYKTKKSEFGSFADQANPFFGSSGNASNPSQWQVFYSFHYLGIPFKVNYRSGSDQWFFVSSLGLNAEFLLVPRQKQILYGSDGTKESSRETLGDQFNSFNLSPCFSLGLEYRLTRQMCIRAEPTFNYGLLQIIDSSISGHLWSTGLRLGCFWNL